MPGKNNSLFRKKDPVKISCTDDKGRNRDIKITGEVCEPVAGQVFDFNLTVLSAFTGNLFSNRLIYLTNKCLSIVMASAKSH